MAGTGFQFPITMPFESDGGLVHYSDDPITHIEVHRVSGVQRAIEFRLQSGMSRSNRVGIHTILDVLQAYNRPNLHITVGSKKSSQGQLSIDQGITRYGNIPVLIEGRANFNGYNEYFPYSYITDKLIRGFPRWTKIRKEPLSIGRQFLNVFGLSMQEIDAYLEEALKNQFIETANLGDVDFIHKSQIAAIDKDLPHTVSASLDGESIDLVECFTLMEFYRATQDQHVYIIDFDDNVIYLRHEDDDFKTYQSVTVNGVEYTDIQVHHVWNVFDEFAMLLGLRRYNLEKNAELKERIVNVFRFPSNSTKTGLISAIGRSVGLIENESWSVSATPASSSYYDIKLPVDRICVDTINLNNQRIHPSQYSIIGNVCRIYPKINVFYRKDQEYELDGVRFTNDHKLMLVEGCKQGHLITPIINPANLGYWQQVLFNSTGSIEVDIVRYDYDTTSDQASAYIVKDLVSGSSIALSNVADPTIKDPIRAIVTLSRESKYYDSPMLENLDLTYQPAETKVSYVKDVKLNALSDENFLSTLFNSDGRPSDRLKGYVTELNNLVPIMWGHFKWNEGYWDVVGKNLMGLHVLPNMWDPRLGEISNVYFQSGIGFGQDLAVKFENTGVVDEVKVIEMAGPNATFTRNCIATKSDSSIAPVGEPRYETSLLNQSIFVEEGTTNLILNGKFDKGLTSWNKLGSPELIDCDVPNIAKCVQFNSTTSDTMRLYQAVQYSTSLKGRPYSISGKVKVDSITLDSFSINIDWLDNKGIYKSNSPVISYNATTNGWVDFSVTVTAPTGAYGLSLKAEFYNGAKGLASVAQLQVEEKKYSTSFVDGIREQEILTIPLNNLNNSQGTWEQMVYINDNTKRIDPSYSNRIFSIPRAGGGYAITVYHSRTSNNWVLEIFNGTITKTVTALDSLTPTGWHRFKVSWSATSAKILIDGILRGTISSPTIGTFGTVGYIGCSATGEQLNTLHDDIRLSSVARVDEDFTRLTKALAVDQYTTIKFTFDNYLLSRKVDTVTVQTDKGWSPQIHSGYYYITDQETITYDGIKGSGVIETTYPEPEFISVVDMDGKTYNVISAKRNSIKIDPVPATGTKLTVSYGTENYLYAKPATFTIDGNHSEFVLTDYSATPQSAFPKQGAPIIVKATDKSGNRVTLKQVVFVDELPSPHLTIVNKEKIAAKGQTEVYLSYDNPVDISMVTLQKPPEQCEIFGIDENKLTLADPLLTDAEVTYKVKDSFVVNATETEVTITLSDIYSEISVDYEDSGDNAFYSPEDPSFDPLLSHMSDGFLFITDQLYVPDTIDVSASPDVLGNNGLDTCLITADVKDIWDNPIPNIGEDDNQIPLTANVSLLMDRINLIYNPKLETNINNVVLGWDGNAGASIVDGKFKHVASENDRTGAIETNFQYMIPVDTTKRIDFYWYAEVAEINSGKFNVSVRFLNSNGEELSSVSASAITSITSRTQYTLSCGPGTDNPWIPGTTLVALKAGWHDTPEDGDGIAYTDGFEAYYADQYIANAGTLIMAGSFLNRKVYKYIPPAIAYVPIRPDGTDRRIPCTATVTFSCGNGATPIQNSVDIKVR